MATRRHSVYVDAYAERGPSAVYLDDWLCMPHPVGAGLVRAELDDWLAAGRVLVDGKAPSKARLLLWQTKQHIVAACMDASSDNWHVLTYPARLDDCVHCDGAISPTKTLPS